MRLAITRSSVVKFAVAVSLIGTFAACGDDDGPTGPGAFPDLRGDWVGQYVVTECTTTVGLNQFLCNEVFYVSRSLPFAMTLQQSSERVDGPAVQGALEGTVDGTVDMAGVLGLDGALSSSGGASTTIAQWETLLVGDSLVGTFSFEVEDLSDSGFGTVLVDAEIVMVGPSVLTYEFCPVELFLAQTDSIDGVLEAGDCQLSDETYYDVYAVEVAVGDSLQITMSSTEYTPFLVIADVDEVILDSAGDTADSVATVALESVVDETWLILANSLDTLETGSYTLTTADIRGAAPVAGLIFKKVPFERRASGPTEDKAAAVVSGRSLAEKFSRRSGAVAKAKREGS
jgi:hypothetical protein